MALLESILWILFTLLCILVSGVILLQEGKGGGLGEAFGGLGQKTFGVKAGGIAKFTGVTSGVLVTLALAISCIRSGSSVVTDSSPAPVEAPAAPAQPAPPDGGGGENG